jgi:hypothetical protein
LNDLWKQATRHRQGETKSTRSRFLSKDSAAIFDLQRQSGGTRKMIESREATASVRDFGLADEPSLEELLDDPVTQAIMAYDGVSRTDISDIFVLVRTAFANAA